MSRSDPSQPHSPQSLLPLVGLFLAALLAAVLAGLGSYRYQRITLEKQAREELSYLAQVQRDHLDFWLQEKLNDVLATTHDPFFGAGFRDRADRVRMERDKALLDRQLKALSRYANDIVLLMDGSGQLIDVNDRALDAYGYTRDQMLSMKIEQLFTPRALVDFFKRFPAAEQLDSLRFESVQRRKDGSTFPVELSSRQFHEHGVTYHQIIIRDITERKLAEEKVLSLQDMLREQAIRDSLTGLYNRRFLDETMERELLLAQRNANPISVIMADLDHFKAVNDRHGHPAGDEVLRVFSEMIALQSRRSDICCRFGGEEFLLVYPGLAKESACERADQLRRRIEAAPFAFGGTPIAVTASFGVACFPQDGSTCKELIAAADQALYAAKAAGRNRVMA